MLNGFKKTKWLNISIWAIDMTLKSIKTLGQCEPESNYDQDLFYSQVQKHFDTHPTLEI